MLAFLRYSLPDIAFNRFLPPFSKHENLRLANGIHSFKSLGSHFYVDVPVSRIRGARLVLFNQELAKTLDIKLPRKSTEIENFVLDLFAWFKADEKTAREDLDTDHTRTFFATRYQDSDDKCVGSALGDGRTVWVGELSNVDVNQRIRYMDATVKGIGITPLAWLNHSKQSHRDGKLGITEAVHEYIYGLAATKNGIDTVRPLAVIELPFFREATGEKAALIVRIGNHLRFAHYRYFSNQPWKLEKIFEYGLKRDLGLPLNYPVTPQNVRNYLDRIVTNLAKEAAVYYDLHAVHGSPTYGNRTSDGGTIDLSTFVYLDAHHQKYSYMPGNKYFLGGRWGQPEQLFTLFSDLIKLTCKSRFKYTNEIASEKFYWEKFRNTMERTLTHRWLKRLGLSENEILALSSDTKNRFHNIVKAIYEAQGTKKIKLNRGRTFLAAFEPRKILSRTAQYFDKFNDINFIWENLFKVHRNWGTFNFPKALPFITEYIKSVEYIVDELDKTGEIVTKWKSRSQQMQLSERRELGSDFFYDSERFISSQEVLAQIHRGKANWKVISDMAADAAEKLVDRGLGSVDIV
ncbi:protein adenylyltransferase SelO family protein [Methylocaldum szegediense]|uniref:Uncharacterized protein n=1 Tax=Methylocaldum szegediense TaxID=73780 RepID=A0ABM9I7A0_9GAMM|nr:protein adenylyltransferase SelO family protein [Methylocaldum szegediense]CAI8937646.1 protein of unknown function [Methylocaldum szegediense]